MRGKHGAQAAVRRSERETTERIAELERLNRNLETENGRLSDDVERWKSAHAADTRLLRAQLEKQTHPELEKALARIQVLSESLEASDEQYKRLHRHWESMLDRIVPWYASVFKVSKIAALENLIPLVGMGSDGNLPEEVRPIVFDPHTAKLGAHRATLIQRARGEYKR